MNIYLAARYSSKERMQSIAVELVQMGFHVVSSWVFSSDRLDESPDYKRGRAVVDCEDVGKAHILILDLLDGEGTRGAQWTEFGIALGQNQRLIVVGDSENIFAYHPRVQSHPDWDSVFQELVSFKGLIGSA